MSITKRGKAVIAAGVMALGIGLGTASVANGSTDRVDLATAPAGWACIHDADGITEGRIQYRREAVMPEATHVLVFTPDGHEYAAPMGQSLNENETSNGVCQFDASDPHQYNRHIEVVSMDELELYGKAIEPGHVANLRCNVPDNQANTWAVNTRDGESALFNYDAEAEEYAIESDGDIISCKLG